MKIVGYILSLYLILLSTVPCCAFDNCPDDKAEQTAEHEKGDEDCGNCSPFFSCGGCSTATINFDPADMEILPRELSTVYTSYKEPDLPRVDYDFWQPPKISA